MGKTEPQKKRDIWIKSNNLLKKGSFYPILYNCLRSLKHTAALSPAAAVLFPLRMSGLKIESCMKSGGARRRSQSDIKCMSILVKTADLFADVVHFRQEIRLLE